MAAHVNEPTSPAEHNVTSVLGNVSQQSSPSQCLVLQFEGVTPWDNPDSVVSAHTEDLVRRLRDTVVLPILFLIGGPANLINMAVFYRHGLKERINVCLFSLSMADLFYLTSSALLYGEQIYVQLTTKEKYGTIMRFMTNHHMIGLYGFTWVSEVISAIIASERCFCILQPLRSQTVMSTSSTTGIIVVVYVVVVGLYFFVTARYLIVCAYDPVTSSDIWIPISSQFYFNNQKVIDFFDVFVYGVGIPLAAIVVVTVTTAVTLVQLRKAAAWRAGTASSSSVLSAREVALTMMLVYNSIFFVICVFPIALTRVVWLFMPEMNAGRRQHNLFFTTIWVLDMLAYVNATFNILIYCIMGSKYRHTFWQIMGRGNRAKSVTKKN